MNNGEGTRWGPLTPTVCCSPKSGVDSPSSTCQFEACTPVLWQSLNKTVDSSAWHVIGVGVSRFDSQNTGVAENIEVSVAFLRVKASLWWQKWAVRMKKVHGSPWWKRMNKQNTNLRGLWFNKSAQHRYKLNRAVKWEQANFESTLCCPLSLASFSIGRSSHKSKQTP